MQNVTKYEEFVQQFQMFLAWHIIIIQDATSVHCNHTQMNFNVHSIEKVGGGFIALSCLNSPYTQAFITYKTYSRPGHCTVCRLHIGSLVDSEKPMER